jgi:hypothetical protein
MIAMVRDDIISLDSFVQAKFKYEKYLLLLKNAGNYCFWDQFKRLFEKGETIAKNMEDLNLIKTETLNNNYKYIYLTDTAMKYLLLKDDPKDYTGVVKNKISVLKVNKYPSEKVLMSSSLKFELIANGKNQIIIKENLINTLRKYFYNQSDNISSNLDEIKEKMKVIKLEYDKAITVQNKTIELLREILSISFTDQDDTSNELEIQIYKELKDLEEEFQNLHLLDKKRKREISEKIINLNHELEKIKFRIKLEKKIEEQIEKTKVPAHSLTRKYNDLKKQVDDHEKDQERINGIDEQFSKLENRILNMYDKSKIVAYFKNEELYFLILDTGNTKTAFGYLKMISELKTLYTFNKINIFVASYSENRAKNLINEFSDTQNEKTRALKLMCDYEKKAGVSRNNRARWNYAPNFYISAEKIYKNTPEINKTEYIKSTIILEVYKKNLSMSENYIRNKDKKSIADLKEKFKEQIIIN